MSSNRHAQGSKWIRRSTRCAIYARDGFCCVYCGRKVRTARGTSGGFARDLATLDHVDPNGGNSPANLVTACMGCNSSKSDEHVTAFVQRVAPLSSTEVLSRVAKRLATAIDRKLGRELAAKGN